eukprot:Opistho-2@78393
MDWGLCRQHGRGDCQRHHSQRRHCQHGRHCEDDPEHSHRPHHLVITAICVRRRSLSDTEAPRESRNDAYDDAPLPQKSRCARVGDSLLVLWDRFPRFVLGFLVSSIILSFAVEPDARMATKEFAFFVSEWFSALGFVGIGLELDFMRFIPKLRNKGGRIVLLYVLTQGMDLLLTGVVAYLAFGKYGDRDADSQDLAIKH